MIRATFESTIPDFQQSNVIKRIRVHTAEWGEESVCTFSVRLPFYTCKYNVCILLKAFL